MEDVYVYLVNLPDGIHEMVASGVDGYTIYIDEKLSDVGRMKAYEHALRHIKNGDFEKESVQEIEYEAHYG